MEPVIIYCVIHRPNCSCFVVACFNVLRCDLICLQFVDAFMLVFRCSIRNTQYSVSVFKNKASVFQNKYSKIFQNKRVISEYSVSVFQNKASVSFKCVDDLFFAYHI